MQKILQRLVAGLEGAYGDQLISVILYGSAASGEYQERSSDLNVTCVLSEISASLLKNAELVVRAFVKDGNPPPMFLAEDEIHNSNDVFPIEFLEMQVNHRVLAGKDVFADLKVMRVNHRLELEHELRSKYLGLRQRYLEVSSRPRMVAALMFESLPAFITLLRHILILTGQSAPIQKRDIIQVFCRQNGGDEAIWLSLLQAKASGKAFDSDEVDLVFARYLEQIAAAVRLIDTLPDA